MFKKTISKLIFIFAIFCFSGCDDPVATPKEDVSDDPYIDIVGSWIKYGKESIHYKSKNTGFGNVDYIDVEYFDLDSAIYGLRIDEDTIYEYYNRDTYLEVYVGLPFWAEDSLYFQQIDRDGNILRKSLLGCRFSKDGDDYFQEFRFHVDYLEKSVQDVIVYKKASLPLTWWSENEKRQDW